MLDQETDSKHFPKYPDVGVIAFVPTAWGGSWQSRQQILTRLTRYFHVVWMAPPLDWREALFSKAADSPSMHPNDSCIDDLILFHPGRAYPRFYKPTWLAKSTNLRRIEAAKDLLRERGCSRFVSYLWRFDLASLQENADFDLTCYHIDDEYSFSKTEKGIHPDEQTLLEVVDQVFISSSLLMRKKGGINPDTLFGFEWR